MSRNLRCSTWTTRCCRSTATRRWAHFIAGLGIDGAARHAQDIDEYYRQYVAGTLDMSPIWTTRWRRSLATRANSSTRGMRNAV